MVLSREQYRKMDMLLADPVGYSNTAIARMVGCGPTTVRHRRRGEPNLGGAAPEYVERRIKRENFRYGNIQHQRLVGGPVVEAEWVLNLNGRRFDE